MKQGEPIVYVIDDDVVVGGIIQRIFDSAEIRAQVFISGEAFVDAYPASPSGPSCLLLDMRLQGMSGLSLLAQLRSNEIRIPVIFMSGYVDVGSAVAAMKAGAVDFLEKPVHKQLLLERVQQALDCDMHRRQSIERRDRVDKRLSALSEREREVMDLLVLGDSSKQIAGKLGICPKTAMRHRSQVLNKLGMDSVVQLVRMLSPSIEDPLLEREAFAALGSPIAFFGHQERSA